MKKTLLLFTAFLLSVASTGCSDDDDNSVEAADLIGKWILVAEYDSDIDEWDYDWADAGYIETLEFRADGTGTDYEKSPNNSGRTEEFTWSLDGNVLTRYFPLKNDTQVDPVEKLTGDELLFFYEYTLKDGNTYVDKALYNRM